MKEDLQQDDFGTRGGWCHTVAIVYRSIFLFLFTLLLTCICVWICVYGNFLVYAINRNYEVIINLEYIEKEILW